MRGPPQPVQTIAEVVAASRNPPPVPTPIKEAPSTTPPETPPTTTPVDTPPVAAIEVEAEAVLPTPPITPADKVVTTHSAAAACVQSEMSIEEASVKAIEVALRNRNRANANASQAMKDELLGGAKGRANKRKSAAV